MGEGSIDILKAGMPSVMLFWLLFIDYGISAMVEIVKHFSVRTEDFELFFWFNESKMYVYDI